MATWGSLVFAVHCAGAGGLADSAWPCLGHDSRHTGQSVYVGAQTADLKWIYQTGDWVSSSAVIGADGTIYIGSDDNSVYALNPDGSLKWNFLTGGHVSSTPAIGADGTIYVGCADYNIYALNPDGGPKWIYQTEHYVNSSPAIGADGTIYIGSIDGNIYALDPYGNPKWIYPTGSCIASTPAIGADGTIYVGSYDYYIYALKPDGSLKWEYKTEDFVSSSPAIGSDGTVYIGSDDYHIYAFSPNGDLKWKSLIGGTVQSAPVIGADGMIYVGSGDKNVYCLSPDGRVKWSYQTGKAIYSSPVIGADGTLYVGSCDGKVYAFGIDTGAVEICDGKDNNADGQIDEGGVCTSVYYRDADNDGYGNPEDSVRAASAPAGYVADNTDCDDTDKNVHPGAPEIPCNGKDDDCQGGDDTTGCSPVAETGKCTEADSGNLDIVGVSGRRGDEVRVAVRIQSAPNDVTALGCKVTYDATVLEYSGFDAGDLVKSFTLFSVNSSSPGTLRIGGMASDKGILKGASGCLVYVKFIIRGGREGECFPLQLQDMKDHIAHFSQTGACVCVLRNCTGDLNGDGEITPLDALIAFNCYLGAGPCFDCVDVNQDGEVTPADAFCLFKRYLEQPSCLD